MPVGTLWGGVSTAALKRLVLKGDAQVSQRPASWPFDHLKYVRQGCGQVPSASALLPLRSSNVGEVGVAQQAPNGSPRAFAGGSRILAIGKRVLDYCPHLARSQRITPLRFRTFRAGFLGLFVLRPEARHHRLSGSLHLASPSSFIDSLKMAFDQTARVCLPVEKFVRVSR